MNILVVSQYYYPEQFRINDMCSQMVKDGHTVTVLTGIPNYPKGQFFEGYGVFKKRCEIHEGVEIIRVPIVPRGRSKLQLALNYLSFVLSGWIRSITLAKREFDIVFVYEVSPITMALPAIAVAKSQGIPLVMFVTDLWPENVQAAGGVQSGLVLGLIGKVVDYIYRSCDHILVSSKSFVKAIANRGHSTEKIEFWPQYAEDLYTQVEAAQSDLIRKDIPEGFNIVFTGNIGHAQGLEVVIDAAEKLKENKDIHWILIGDGRAKAELQKMAQEKGLRNIVKFISRKPVELMPSYLELADAALITLKDDTIFSMTLPAKLQSYMACGIPILASINGEAANTVLEAEAGLVCDAGDAEGLATIVRQLYEMPEEERKGYGRNAAKYFRDNYTKEKLMNRYYEILAEQAR